ncbi:hypothetical protein ACH5RR_013110 [Cinchona calisaya]|uniref:Uncharacterized protein n=1 Tax=Cinchona calisaya TaxID=153742 RepID=A0ABD3A0G7_9GENT
MPRMSASESMIAISKSHALFPLFPFLGRFQGRSRPDVPSLDSSLSQVLWHDESPIVALRAWGEKMTSGVFPPFADTSTTTFDGCFSFGAFTYLSVKLPFEFGVGIASVSLCESLVIVSLASLWVLIEVSKVSPFLVS